MRDFYFKKAIHGFLFTLYLRYKKKHKVVKIFEKSGIIEILNEGKHFNWPVHKLQINEDKFPFVER